MNGGVLLGMIRPMTDEEKQASKERDKANGTK